MVIGLLGQTATVVWHSSFSRTTANSKTLRLHPDFAGIWLCDPWIGLQAHVILFNMYRIEALCTVIRDKRKNIFMSKLISS